MNNEAKDFFYVENPHINCGDKKTIRSKTY